MKLITYSAPKFIAPLAALTLVGTLVSCGSTRAPGPFWSPYYGAYQRPVTTASSDAQRWFDQGLLLVYGFNHDEAIHSFEAATESDPGCAMAWWGIAYASGVDINDNSTSEESNRTAHEAAQEALRRLDDESPFERALVEAIAVRYAWPAPEDRSALDRAYADAMERAWYAHRGDPDVGALYAEALMLLQPWAYWSAAGEALGRCDEIVDVLERAIATEPLHPGANHFYIHAIEASSKPERAVLAADTLRDLVPGSGHLVHMPSHIYINVGRYQDAIDANVLAIAADDAYFAATGPPGFYALYYAHNIHFVAFCAMMDAQFETALEYARLLESAVPAASIEAFPGFIDGVMPATFHVLVRFGRWQEILDEPDYAPFRLASRAMRHYARAVAFANLGRTAAARAELASLDALVPELGDSWSIGVNPAADVVALARTMALGEIEWNEGASERAIETLRGAVAMEDGLRYDEPPGWMQPVRHALGALLLVAGRAEEAETVYLEDLADNQSNAWGLLGLDQALRARGRVVEADQLAQRLAAAWARSDVEPPASCYCGRRP